MRIRHALLLLLPLTLITGCRHAATSTQATTAAQPTAPAAPAAPEPPATAPATQVAAAPADATEAPVFLDVPTRFKGKLIRTRTRYFTEKLLALTFDDGPSKNITPRILATLKKRGAHATFFELGCCIPGNEAIVKQIIADGHAIGSHSYNHLASASPEKAASELDRTAALISKNTGHAPQLFRPPYGITTGNLCKTAQQRGYVVLNWTISSADTDAHATVAKIASNVIHTPNPGDIVLMHDSSNHDFTARALPQMLDELGAAGFRFVTIPELLTAWDKWLASKGK